VANGFYELNDPTSRRAFLHTDGAGRRGRTEAADGDYIRALSHACPRRPAKASASTADHFGLSDGFRPRSVSNPLPLAGPEGGGRIIFEAQAPNVFFQLACNSNVRGEAGSLRSPYRPAVLRLVTLFSKIGVAAGGGTLVIAISSTRVPRNAARRFSGGRPIVSSYGTRHRGNQEYEEMATSSQRTGASFRDRRYQTVLAVIRRAARGVVTKGIDPERERKVTKRCRASTPGAGTFLRTLMGLKALLIGKQLAQEWKILSPGDVR